MQTKTPWFDRKFDFDFPAEKMPDIMERLRGTPVRLEAIVSGITDSMLDRREQDETWSIKENIGHLADLEPLWSGRVHDIVAGHEYMRDADLTNQPTFDADHNARTVSELVSDFLSLRTEFVKSISGLDEKQWSAAALHPRLKTPMRIVDLCLFVADHDDYHLARIRYLAELFQT